MTFEAGIVLGGGRTVRVIGFFGLEVFQSKSRLCVL